MNGERQITVPDGRVVLVAPQDLVMEIEHTYYQRRVFEDASMLLLGCALVFGGVLLIDVALNKMERMIKR